MPEEDRGKMIRGGYARGEDGMPTVRELKYLAKELGMPNYYLMRKATLIWAIQQTEGHNQCYQRIPGCGQMDCLFRKDCLEPEQALSPSPRGVRRAGDSTHG